MMDKVLILGGYGNFGARITASLLKKNIPVIIAGRNADQAAKLQNTLLKAHQHAKLSTTIFDAHAQLADKLTELKPKVVVNTIGPFQKEDYSIPQICIQHGTNYIDLADARDFVTNIITLDQSAKQYEVLVVSGASTVPGLSSAVIDHYKKYFAKLETLTYGISPGARAPRGLATTESILTYLGKPLKPCGKSLKRRYGWQDIYRETYPELGKRWMANCDIPDIDLFMARYQLKDIHFSAGMESSVLHLGMWLVSYLVRLGLPIDLPKHATKLLAFSHWFDFLGTTSGGMHMILKGISKGGKPLTVKWYLIAKSNDGPQIPCVPAIILSQKLLDGTLSLTGAMPCVGLISLKEYLNELQGFNVHEFVDFIEGSN